jgi:hypothetical protein
LQTRPVDYLATFSRVSLRFGYICTSEDEHLLLLFVSVPRDFSLAVAHLALCIQPEHLPWLPKAKIEAFHQYNMLIKPETHPEFKSEYCFPPQVALTNGNKLASLPVFLAQMNLSLSQ